MEEIKKLDAHVADMIAAGEVVERPASVAKELMENAIDAGATALTVEIQRGGMSLIRVTDNGSGIAAEQSELAFLRHATSKIRKAQDLESIASLGFRGEALAAIASVSRIELLSKTRGAQLGTALLLEGGVVRTREESGCPEGTTIVVRDLFFNTPARLKFMKRDASESAAVFALVQRVALSHPTVSVKFIRDGKQELLTPGDGKLSSLLYAVFGRDLALGFTELKSSAEGIAIEGFVSLPACCRGTRGYQHFICNGRPIRAPLLMAALERAYENQKMVGKFPACVLHITLRPATVDVNVHPAKSEVKFLNERAVFDALYYAVLSALDKDNRHPLLQMPEPKPVAAPSPVIAAAQSSAQPKRQGAGFANMNTQQFRDGMTQQSHSVSTRSPMPTIYVDDSFDQDEMAEMPKPAMQTAQVKATQPSRVPVQSETPQQPIMRPPSPTEAEAPRGEQAPWRIAGEVMDTYIIIEQGEEILFIDKHAAHERMHFERMRSEAYAPMMQSLLAPQVLKLPPEDAAALTQDLAQLEQLGFALEAFGGDDLLLRGIPTELSLEAAQEALCELAGKLRQGAKADVRHLRDEILHTVACKAAIKGGQKSAHEELVPIAKAVMAGEVKYCPHGRPVAVHLTKSQLERRFGRA